jgi:hypothetical protein
MGVEDFQEYVHARDAIQKKLFQEAEEWILEKDTDWFSLLRISVSPYS